MADYRRRASACPAEVWLSVKRDIEAKIISGEWAAGAKIPTLVELGERYNIGRTTAQKVVNSLHEEGLIAKKVSVGCTVKPFVREKLSGRRKEELKQLFICAAEEACLLGLDKSHALKLMEETFDTIGSKKSLSAE